MTVGDDLHNRAVGAIKHGGGRDSEASALGGTDAGMREGTDEKAGLVANEDAHAAEACRAVDFRRELPVSFGALAPSRTLRSLISVRVFACIAAILVVEAWITEGRHSTTGRFFMG